MRKGFTLVELLIVIIIIGILATLALPQYTRMTNRARWAEGVQLAGAIKTAQSLYYAEYGNAWAVSVAQLQDPGLLQLPAATDRQFVFAIDSGNIVAAHRNATNAVDDAAGIATAGATYVIDLDTGGGGYAGDAPGALE